MPQRSLNGLTVKKLTKPGRYGDGGGLYLQVRDANHRSWLFRYKKDGRARQMGLGPLELVDLAEARELAIDARRLLLKGIDPIDSRNAKRQAEKAEAPQLSFEAVAERYIAAHEASWRNPVHRAQWRSTLLIYVHPVFGAKGVDRVETADVMRVLDGLWQAKPETASRIRGRIESILDYAKARGWRSGENPARWRGHLDHLLPKRSKVARVQHHAALPWREIGDFMVRLRGADSISARALEFAILTAGRTGEIIGADWSEIDLEAATWTIPGHRMKAGVEHRVPLSARAIEILRAMEPLRRRPDGPVFPSNRGGASLSQMALTQALRRLGANEVTVHGFRSTFRDWAAESTGFPREVAEAALAHTIGNKVEAAYRRGDMLEKRRKLMSDWETYCARATAPAGEVVAMRAAS